MTNRLLSPFLQSKILLRVYDIAAIFLTGILSLAMRMDGQVPYPFMRNWLVAAVFCLPIYFFTFRGFGMYSRMWRYASVGDLMQIVKAVSFHTASITGAIYILELNYPRGAIIISWLTMLSLIGGIRYLMRLISERELGQSGHGSGEPTLVLGAGSAGQQLVRELMRGQQLGVRIIGFLDDDPNKLGMSIQGHKVLGTIDDLELLATAFAVRRVILALPTAAGLLIRQVTQRAAKLGLKVQTVPSVFEIIDGKVALTAVRPVRLEDLLRRPPVRLDHSALQAMVADKTVLVTGAGGSIGSEICRQLLTLKPKTLLLLGRGENSIYEILEELQERSEGPEKVNLLPLICDVRNLTALERIFAEHKPQLIFHAAAHKHVPLMESFPAEAIVNNVFGTKNVAELALKYDAERFVMISTDKAVDPSNAMGASKRAAELIIENLVGKGTTQFMVVRFGNVLGSRGSAPLKFQRQIAKGGPVTITDERMTRYFMTIPEAVQLVLQAGAMGEGGELFILDMGEPVRMLDMINDLIRLSGYEPGKDIQVIEIGSRPGDKLYEELLTPEEGTMASKHEKITIAKAKHLSVESYANMLNELEVLSRQPNLKPEQLIECVKKAESCERIN